MVSGFLFALLLGFAGVFASGGSAYAASCSYGGCTGKDPVAQGCGGDARTVATGGGSLIELRYSPSCRAYWTRKQGPHTSCSVTSTLRVYKFNSDKGLLGYRSKSVCNHTGNVWTPMIGASTGSSNYFQGALLNSTWGNTWTGTDYHPCSGTCPTSVEV